MSVKTLMRRTKLNRSIITPEPDIIDKAKSMLGRLFSPSDAGSDFIHRMGRHRKSADELPLSTIDRIKESIVFNAPSLAAVMNNTTLRDILSKLKLPLIATLGISFIAGLAYLAYRLYTNYTTTRKRETIDTIMKDIEATAPDLVGVQGWRESIRNEVEEATNRNTPADLVSAIAGIKSAVIKHQHSINAENIGSGINMFAAMHNYPTHAQHAARTLPAHMRGRGRGVRVPM